VLLLPESPRFLALRGQPDAALATLARLHARGNATDPFVRAQHAEILAEIESERAQGPATYGELFTTPSLLRRLVLGCALQAGLQLTGISAIEYYSPDVFAAYVLCAYILARAGADARAGWVSGRRRRSRSRRVTRASRSSRRCFASRTSTGSGGGSR
jgi:hypothetical protein